MKQKLFCLSICIGFSVFCIGQGLLLNGGFEDENICTEYNVNCAPEAWISSSDGFSNYFKDNARAYSGSHCLAIVAGHRNKPYYRAYIRSQMLCAMRKGSQYKLQLFVKSPHAILDSIGVYFTSFDPLPERMALQRITPDLYFSESGTFRKDSSWQQVTLTYTATGKEAFITIANFSNRDISGPTGIDKENSFFVFIDNVTLLPVDDKESTCSNWRQVKQHIYEQDPRHEFLRRLLRAKAGKQEPVILATNHITVMDTLLLPDMLFATGRKDLQKESFAMLDSFCRIIQQKTIDSLVIEGHTDNTGTVEGNDLLSAARAQSVDTYLQQCINPGKAVFILRGWGSRKPVDDNNTAAGRQRNRRVEILFYTRE